MQKDSNSCKNCGRRVARDSEIIEDAEGDVDRQCNGERGQRNFSQSSNVMVFNDSNLVNDGNCGSQVQLNSTNVQAVESECSESVSSDENECVVLVPTVKDYRETMLEELNARFSEVLQQEGMKIKKKGKCDRLVKPSYEDCCENLDILRANDRAMLSDEAVEFEPKEKIDLLSKFSRNIVLKILGYLSMKDLIHNVSLVSKGWNSMANDPALWSKIDLRGYVVTDIVLKKIPQLCSFINYVWLPDAYNDDFTDEGMKTLAKGCPLLRTLIAPRCAEKFSDEAIIAFTEHCQKLEELYLDSLDVGDVTLKHITQKLTKLRVLSLCQVSPMTNGGVAEIFKSCRTLEELFLNHNQQITDDCFIGISDSNQSLRRLEVMMCSISPSGVPAIGKLRNLELLNLTQCTNLTAEHLIPVIKGCKSLQTLGLNLNKFIDDECVYLILTHLPGLRNIYLVSTIITDKAMDIMGWKGKNLERVDLGYTKITEVGARKISERCPTLNYLGLMRCDKIPESVVEELAVQYPHIMYSTFIQDAKRLIKRIEDENGELGDEEELES